jgi:Holliday junction resolvase YEN1
MGVAGLWDVRTFSCLMCMRLTLYLKVIRPAGQSHSLPHLATTAGFEANRSGLRGYRVSIDASIWFFHANGGREGENPELRTLFFKCVQLTTSPFLPLFVFDGPKRPSMKRGKKVKGEAYWLTNGTKRMVEAFGFEWRTVSRFFFHLVLFVKLQL